MENIVVSSIVDASLPMVKAILSTKYHVENDGPDTFILYKGNNYVGEVLVYAASKTIYISFANDNDCKEESFKLISKYFEFLETELISFVS